MHITHPGNPIELAMKTTKNTVFTAGVMMCHGVHLSPLRQHLAQIVRLLLLPINLGFVEAEGKCDLFLKSDL